MRSSKFGHPLKEIGRLFLMMASFLLATVTCISQESVISTDRPDQSDGVSTVTKSRFQIENGITIARKTLLNNFMLRYGIGSTTELRLQMDAGKDGLLTGLQPVIFGMKQQILQQKHLIPAITFIGIFSYEKIASPAFQSNRVTTEMKLAFENELSDKFTLGYNFGTSENFSEILITTGIGYASSENLSVFAEYFSAISDSENAHNIDLGLLFLVTPHLQLDIAAGRSLFDSDNRYFGTVGFSYLFDR